MQFWRDELKAPNNIIRLNEEGCILPPVSLPSAYL